MLDSLFVDLDLNLMFLTEILEFSLLIPKLCLLVFKFFLGHYPEIVNSLSLVLVETSEVFLLPDRILQLSAFLSE
jgi:hypothetical protein